MQSIAKYRTTSQYKAQKKYLQEQSDNFLNHSLERKTINYLGIACSSVNMDDNPPRTPHTTKLLEQSLARVQELYPDQRFNTKTHVLNGFDFDHCEANYSTAGHYCTRPCWISQRMSEKGKTDPLTSLYSDLVDRADVIIIATPIRRGSASSLYFKLLERLNCIENQKEVYGVNLIHNKLLGMIIVGAQDGVQHVMGSIMSIRSQFGYEFPKYPFVGYTTGGFTNDDTDTSTETIEKDMVVIQEMMDDMLKGQVENVLARRAYQKSKK